MNLFDVYPLLPVEPVRAEGCFVWDREGTRYLDFYGGHAVISIGHRHPRWIGRIERQLGEIAFYSNTVRIRPQEELAEKLGALSGYPDFRLFLCNSGAEANENAFKLASFRTGRPGIVACSRSFHGRTSLAVAATDDDGIRAAVNSAHDVRFVPLNDAAALQAAVTGRTAAVIIEGIQGVAGVRVPDDVFLRAAREACDRAGAALIIDEVQSGFGRSGRFFAHQYAGIRPDLITVAKGMGNGFPIAGVLVSPDFKARPGMLGTTFGGSHLACAAALAVVETIADDGLTDNARAVGDHLMRGLSALAGVRETRGRGLMIGVELDRPAAAVRARLLSAHRIFTGSSSDPRTIRLLPPLTATREHADEVLHALSIELAQEPAS